jgi:hypothetical protein
MEKAPDGNSRPRPRRLNKDRATLAGSAAYELQSLSYWRRRPLYRMGGMPDPSAALRLGLTTLAVLSLGVASAACQGDRPTADGSMLTALEADALASSKPAGGELVVNLREEGIPGNKRVPARLLRVFAFRDSAHADSGRNAVLDIAVDGGWKLHQSGKGDTENVYFGGKRLPTGPAMVEIRQYDEHGVDKVSIRLEHTECPRILCGDG